MKKLDKRDKTVPELCLELMAKILALRGENAMEPASGSSSHQVAEPASGSDVQGEAPGRSGSGDAEEDAAPTMPTSGRSQAYEEMTTNALRKLADETPGMSKHKKDGRIKTKTELVEDFKAWDE